MVHWIKKLFKAKKMNGSSLRNNEHFYGETTDLYLVYIAFSAARMFVPTALLTLTCNTAYGSTSKITVD